MFQCEVVLKFSILVWEDYKVEDRIKVWVVTREIVFLVTLKVAYRFCIKVEVFQNIPSHGRTCDSSTLEAEG